MSMLEWMTSGYPWKQCTRELLNIELLSHSSNVKSDKIPIYIQRLFKNMINNIYNVEINMRV